MGAAEMKWVPPFYGATREMEPERAWVGPSLAGMSAYRTVCSECAGEYGIDERKKFARCLLIRSLCIQ